ncbi:hypothetical protein EVAR_89009_1 [Eumeta japonica]|uniref:Cuticle protein CPCFC domain-containing protein n=1 Tax=Eumeta variegata TaxID=151549 RepID=A0A4C1X817_EUMVA|nr:hypothetical protein EVAR_89009_1 [Eumeta japonica]
MHRFSTPRPLFLHPRVPILRHCDDFVTKFTAAEFRALYCTVAGTRGRRRSGRIEPAHCIVLRKFRAAEFRTLYRTRYMFKQKKSWTEFAFSASVPRYSHCAHSRYKVTPIDAYTQADYKSEALGPIAISPSAICSWKDVRQAELQHLCHWRFSMASALLKFDFKIIILRGDPFPNTLHGVPFSICTHYDRFTARKTALAEWPLILSCVAALTLAREYPAGVHPAVCPDYPFCDAATLARFTPDGMPIPEWGLYPGLVRAVAPVEAPAGVPAAPKYPADFNAALCPNYPYCW